MTTETRTLDERVAVALGWTHVFSEHPTRPGVPFASFGWRSPNQEVVMPLPGFSSIWDGAGQVIDAMRERGYGMALTVPRATHVGQWGCVFSTDTSRGEGYDESPFVAICEAALEVLEATDANSDGSGQSGVEQ